MLPALSLGAAVDTTVYDDFGGTGISSARWTSTGSGFTQPGDGYLRFNSTGPDRSLLVSTAVFTRGVFTMPFANYRCNNTAPAGEGLGSVAALGLSDPADQQWVRIERGQVRGDPRHGLSGGYIEVNWVSPGAPDRIEVNYVQSEWRSGFLQIRSDGSRVTFLYRAREIDPWTQMVVTGRGGQPVPGANGQLQPLVVTRRWQAGVPLFIQAFPGGTRADRYSMSFDVDWIEAAPLPEK